MKTTVILVVLAFYCLSCQPQTQTQSIALGEDAHAFKQLQLFAIVGTKQFLESRPARESFVKLADALREGKAVIQERDAASDSNGAYRTAEVSRLVVVNNSPDTLLILGGELIKGGRQDRTIAADVVVPPNSGEFDLSVFCVEQHRWSGSDGKFDAAGDIFVPTNVRRAAIKESKQEEVWEEVEVYLSLNGISAPTSSVAAPKVEEVNAVNAAYNKALGDLFTEPDVIGVIAVSGGNVIACDVFSSHELFGKYYPDLLQSYAAEAMTESDFTPVDRKTIEDYFNTVVMEKARAGNFFHSDRYGKRVVHFSTF